MLPIFFLTIQYKMAGKKFFRRKRQVRKRGMRIRRKGGLITLTNTSGLSPIPARYVTKMKYATAFTLTGAGMRQYQFNLNGLFDPERTGVGHSPYGYDQLLGPPGGVGLYNRYRVFKVDYVITVANDAYNIHYAVLNTNDASPPINNVSEARENPRCQYQVQNPGGTLKQLKGSISLPALMGKTPEQYRTSDTTGATYNSIPSEQAIMNVYMQGLNDDVSVSMSHTVNAILVFHCECTDPHALDQS